MHIVTDSLITILIHFNYFVLFYMIFVNAIYTLLFLVSIHALYIHRQKKKYWSYEDMLASNYTPPLSLIIPCYNEESTINDNVKALLSMNYREFELIIVNDGSKDSTLDQLISEFELQKIKMPYRRKLNTEEINDIYFSRLFDNIVVVDKKNGGKADALNAGINISKYPIITAIDADSILERDSLAKVIRPFVEDPSVVVSGGVIRPVNDCVVDKGFIESIHLSKKHLVRFQTVEYLRAFLFGRLGWGSFNALLIISGAFGVFNKDVVIEAGGYTEDTVGEDMELIVKIHRNRRKLKKPYKIVFIPDPVCWTQVPEDRRILKNQRKRWHKGLMDTMLNHKSMLLNFKYGSVGLMAMPYFFLAEMLGGVIEVFGYLFVPLSFLLGIVSFEFFIVFLILSILYGIFLSSSAILLDEYSFSKYNHVKEYLILILYSILENVGYRQMNAWWRCKAFFEYRRGKKSWGDMTRTQFTAETTNKKDKQ
ncbi:Glycosyltransferase, catalytic subunit of cellulose synthase and poly-beta-1,6-N-acetylglucosamine synthase [Pelagirhabdus alkalitolerans]|uniref:Glycosyltransferase, catalytic subunit of cellulose synthase and poly-beta-1,6-N-acetylglucosamine synthase n=1 Tax=Pelagirhabdus alkalitolerans TaxID=1612202 RepID=A0A1G6LGH1_9BACI|nr:glycosyltransferase family 2 protein [Pelagirhabdus alkalitolerans]SDC41676.1 Glycosyltransferase, catalytic subunit of cellulose synthase and poly-beta-1,6-N-acetylglucosamine synthase [Pelagirhabdus alkalitolerans]